ncbi:sugar transferase [Lacticaseibacillus paracasei]|uniref:sugar transferase n=1 Tax=Lacticaseibacillus paracasei TaxID=1597 RepID=UPI002A59CD0C|nr:sugar transferase [Lacticaseibacillus paracasei]MDY0839212.1 sugar transferase [Lacticaseibacillus paracasei]
MSERRSQHLVNRVHQVTATVDDEICLSKEAVVTHKAYRIAKRICDIIFGATALIAISPVLLIVAIAIKVEDPAGPIFFSQLRVGTDGKLFRMWKFRSMVVGAEKMVDKLVDQNEIDGAMFKLKADPRVTRIGRFIRKYSLDELPQLYNVLRGDMSIVGPRPPLPREVADYTDYDRQRLLVTPGATGLWQVSGRSDVSFDEMVQLDIQYINSASLWMDIKIIFKTFGVFVKHNGAY